MKIKTFLAAGLCLLSICTAASANDEIIFADGVVLTENHDVWCSANGRFVDFNTNGVAFTAYTETLPEGAVNYVPIRTVSEALGLLVGYNHETASIELRSADRILVLTTNSPYATLYDTSYNPIESITLTASQTVLKPCSVRNINDTTYIPIRAVTESFGFNVGWESGQIILSNTGVTPTACVKDDVSKPITVYGMSREIRIANAPSEGFLKYKENNNFTDLTGDLCRTRAEGMWIIGIAESQLEYYDAVVPKEYFDCIYYKSSPNSPWQIFTEEVPMGSIHDISINMTTVTGTSSFTYENTSEISDSNLRGALEFFAKSYGHAPKMTLDEYHASFDSLLTGQSEDATVYKITLTFDENKIYYILKTSSGYSFIPETLMPSSSLSDDITVNLPGTGTLRIFCDIIIVDIVDA